MLASSTWEKFGVFLDRRKLNKNLLVKLCVKEVALTVRNKARVNPNLKYCLAILINGRAMLRVTIYL